MIDYGTVDDILSTTQNMTVLRNNSLQDDGTDTVEGVEWFRYKGKVASTLYVRGNSWIGFGENAEHLKIVRRDTDLMTLRREEGTLWGTYRFLRIRWEGYSVHGNRNDATRMIWDAILFDTGEICVRFDTIPTNSSYLAESSLVAGNGIVAFTAITGRVISFRPKDDNGTEFEYVDHAPVFLDPYNRRYWLRMQRGQCTQLEKLSFLYLRTQSLLQNYLKLMGYRIFRMENCFLRLRILPFYTGMIRKIVSRI